MNYITVTQLRTHSKKLAYALEKGQEVTLVKRSMIIGKVVPQNEGTVKIINAKKLEAKIDKLDLPRLTHKEIDRRYRVAMMKKHGKGLS